MNFPRQQQPYRRSNPPSKESEIKIKRSYAVILFQFAHTLCRLTWVGLKKIFHSGLWATLLGAGAIFCALTLATAFGKVILQFGFLKCNSSPNFQCNNSIDLHIAQFWVGIISMTIIGIFIFISYIVGSFLRSKAINYGTK